ncbi:MAG: RHS repeat-associated core domain-containing protein [Bacteroidales bacterium]|nr:RHS repeat-associated core domain-containing protein [Bacteroidales bacterium]
MQQGTNAASTYRYGYDGLGRLTTSSRYAGSGTSATNSWCERGIDYDLNGNIVTLQRFGSSASTAEDNLVYGYTGNRLTALTGSSLGAELNASYSYDAGGNMVYDGRRGLGISYNMLNLPAKVVEKTGATAADGAVKAEYLYSADGIKQRVVDGAGSNGYLYLGTLVLSKSGESYSLASTGFGGGRIIGTANNSCLAYYYGTDHLGSVRVITDGSGSVVERNDYYPMGMRTAIGNSYPQLATNLYKYNGKEVQTVGDLGFTDYGARMYDDFTGRWFVPDLLAEKYASMSPYMYCGGNPIMFFDLDGRDPIYAKNFWGKIKQIGDDGRNSIGSYLVRGSVARKVRATTKAGYYYTGDLSENKKIMHIPTGQIQQDVQQTALATIRSGDSPETRIESGGHALKGDKSARIWDTGTEMKMETLEDGSVKQWWSVDPFRIGGKKKSDW